MTSKKAIQQFINQCEFVYIPNGTSAGGKWFKPYKIKGCNQLFYTQLNNDLVNFEIFEHFRIDTGIELGPSQCEEIRKLAKNKLLRTNTTIVPFYKLEQIIE